jgi:hypothetical protein
MEVSTENQPTQVLDLDALEKVDNSSTTIEFEEDALEKRITQTPENSIGFSFSDQLIHYSNGKIKDRETASRLIAVTSIVIILGCIAYNIFF